jgi:hypothetical protein
MSEIVNWININHSWVVLMITIAIPIIVSEFGECATWICQTMIYMAASFLSLITTPEVGQKHRELWQDALLQTPGKLIKIIRTFVILAESVPRIWWVIAGEDIPANLRRRALQRVTGWHRSRFSSKYGVEMARLPGGLVAVRSRRSNSVQIFKSSEIKEFLDAIKNGGYEVESLPSV